MEKLGGVILDWAGTTVDFGCFAPTAVFLEMFRAHGVEITIAEARAPMGTFKKDHIRAITQMPRVAEAWQTASGRLPDEADVDALYQAFIPRQIEVIGSYSTLIPGVAGAVDALRARGLRIGSCTGYTRAMMAELVPAAAAQGYAPDAVVCPDDTAGGRPAPWMCFRNAELLGIYPMRRWVKIGDTVSDVHEGLNAGMWAIGIAMTGNELGLSRIELESMPSAKLQPRLQAARARLQQAGAHLVVDGLSDVLPALDALESRLQAGERP